MRYYAIDKTVLAGYGIGDEPWRRTNGGKALVSESEVILSMGFPSAREFEERTGIAPMTHFQATGFSQ